MSLNAEKMEQHRRMLDAMVQETKTEKEVYGQYLENALLANPDDKFFVLNVILENHSPFGLGEVALEKVQQLANSSAGEEKEKYENLYAIKEPQEAIEGNADNNYETTWPDEDYKNNADLVKKFLAVYQDMSVKIPAREAAVSAGLTIAYLIK